LFSSWLRAIKDYLKGFFLYGLLSHLYAEKRCVENLFMLGVFGSAVGFPLLFNYYYFRLMPHYVRHLGPWKKERDFFDQVSD
jgi:hypothetical protein